MVKAVSLAVLRITAISYFGTGFLGLFVHTQELAYISLASIVLLGFFLGVHIKATTVSYEEGEMDGHLEPFTINCGLQLIGLIAIAAISFCGNTCNLYLILPDIPVGNFWIGYASFVLLIVATIGLGLLVQTFFVPRTTVVA